MQPFTINIYEKNTFNATKFQFWYDDDGKAKAWTLEGLRNGGHESNSYSDIWNDDYTKYEGAEAVEAAKEYLQAVLNN